MKFFPALFKALAAAGAAALVVGLQAVLGVFSGPVPSDVSPTAWALIAAGGILVVNFLIGLINKPAP